MLQVKCKDLSTPEAMLQGVWMSQRDIQRLFHSSLYSCSLNTMTSESKLLDIIKSELSTADTQELCVLKPPTERHFLSSCQICIVLTLSLLLGSTILALAILS